MPLIIKDSCINCDMCRPECPNNAISYKNNKYCINQNLCNECIGFYDKPACKTVCPIKNTIVDKKI